MNVRVKKLLWGAGGTAIALFPALLLGHVEGPDVRHSGGPGDKPMSCADADMCHTATPATGGPTNAYGGSVTAIFSTGGTYTPGGAPVTITVTVNDPTKNWSGYYGFQMSARLDSDLVNGQAGHFVEGGANQAVFCDYTAVLALQDNFEGKNGCGLATGTGKPVVEFIEHAFPSKESSAQTTPYTFTWMPPATNVGLVHFYVAGNAVNNDHNASGADHVYTNSYVLAPATTLPTPTLVAGGVLNAASFSKDAGGLGSAVAPGSLVAIFGGNLGGTVVDSPSSPLANAVDGVLLTFNSTGAPIKDVIPTGPYPFVNAQVPFELTGSSAALIATVNGVPSSPLTVPIVPSAPGLFTIPPTGLGNAVLVFVDTDGKAKIAAAASASGTIGYATAPIKRGGSGFFYATGLGAMTPPVTDGDGGGIITHTANIMPNVFIGGVMVTPGFAGQAPGFPGVYQVNLTIPSNAPTGNSVQIWMTTPDGSVTSNKATIAVQ